MATITITTTPEQDAAAQRYVTELNAANTISGVPPTTPGAWVRRYVTDKLDQLITDYKSRDTLTKAEIYKIMTPEDRAIVDPVFDKYQNGLP